MHVHRPEQVASHWLDGFHAESMYVGGGVISRQGGQIDAGDGLQQPGRLSATQSTEL